MKSDSLRTIQVGDAVLSTQAISDELQEYTDVLIGRQPSPIDSTATLALAEVASAYYARAKEIEMVILRAERNGNVKRGDIFYKLRTGELRSFIELAQNAYELGSRRVTVAQHEERLREI